MAISSFTPPKNFPHSVFPIRDMFKVSDPSNPEDYGARCVVIEVEGALFLNRVSGKSFIPVAQWPFPSLIIARQYAENRYLADGQI